MPLERAERNPDSSILFHDSNGGTLLTASTPASENEFARLARRQEQSAPLAMGGPPADTSGGSGGAPGAIATGSYDRPINPPVVSDVGPSMADQGAQGASSGYSAPPPAATVPEVKAPAAPGRVDPSSVSFAGAPAQAGAAPAGSPSFADASADMFARAALAPGGGGHMVKGGTFQTGQDVKVKNEGGKAPERIGAMAGEVGEAAIAGQKLAKAQVAYEKDVENRTEFARFMQSGFDDLHQGRKQKALREIHDQRERLDAEIADTQIDPQGFWADKTAGDKIGFVLAAAITGAFNGYAGKQGNQVLDVVNKRIDENISAQVRNLDSKKSRSGELGRIYQQAKEQWGDETVARNVAKAAALAVAEKTVRQQALDSRSELVKAQAEKFAADLAAQREKLWFDNAGTVTTEMDKKYKVTQDHVEGGGLSLEKRAGLLARAGEQQAKGQDFARGPDPSKGPQTAVFGGETHEMRGVSPQEGEHIRTKLSVVDVLKRDLAEVRKLRDENVSEKLMPSAYQKDVIGRISENLSTLKGMGVVRESDVQRTMDAFSSVRSGAESLASTEGFLHSTGQAILRQAGSRAIGKAK